MSLKRLNLVWSIFFFLGSCRTTMTPNSLKDGDDRRSSSELTQEDLRIIETVRLELRPILNDLKEIEADAPTTDSRAPQLAPKYLLEHLKGIGYTVDQSAEIQRYLNYRQANAATFLNKDILLKLDARKLEVLEEYMHNVQEQLSIHPDIANREIQVKVILLRQSEELGLNNGDLEWIRKWLIGHEVELDDH